jgi:hypothetical protein
LKIDNNLGKTQLDPSLWEEKLLFCGNDDAAENAAIVYPCWGLQATTLTSVTG